MTIGGRILVRGGLVVDPGAGKADRVDLLIEAGEIVQIGAPGALPDTGAVLHDASDRLIVPGLVNAHTHGHANLMKGVADAWTLEASLTNGPWLGGARDPETIYLSTLLGAVDMLSKGGLRPRQRLTPMPACAPYSHRWSRTRACSSRHRD